LVQEAEEDRAEEDHRQLITQAVVVVVVGEWRRALFEKLNYSMRLMRSPSALVALVVLHRLSTTRMATLVLRVVDHHLILWSSRKEVVVGLVVLQAAQFLVGLVDQQL
jgi:hypothetical protein